MDSSRRNKISKYACVLFEVDLMAASIARKNMKINENQVIDIGDCIIADFGGEKNLAAKILFLSSKFVSYILYLISIILTSYSEVTDFLSYTQFFL